MATAVADAAEAHRASRRMPARDLAEVPEVDAFLQRLGLGAFLTESLQGFVGRNDIWAGTTDSGKAVLVKKLSGDPVDAGARMRRIIAYERLASSAPAGALLAPPCLGWDEEQRLVAFEYLQGADTGSELMVDERFDDALAERVGAGLALLHDAPCAASGLDDLPPLLPSLELLDGLPEPVFMNASAAEQQAWALMQRDQELKAGIQSLIDLERAAPRVLAHCDLRVDQLLLHEGSLYLADWEEFRLADAARDVGSFAGEWLYRAMLDIVTHRGDEGGDRTKPIELDTATVLARGVAKLERLRPTVEAFWKGYRTTRQGMDPGLSTRAAGFAGWHLLDRLLAGAVNNSRLQPVQRAAAGVGRTALLSPREVVTTLGLGDPDEVRS